MPIKTRGIVRFAEKNRAHKHTRTNTERIAPRMSGTKVILHVYDLHDANAYVHTFGLGAYHSGVEVFGVEYAFGGADVAGVTGIFESTPKVVPPGCKFRESIVVGETSLSKLQTRSLIVDLMPEYAASSYHILNRNCNTFSNDLCLRLTGGSSGLPAWINRLSSLGSMFSFALPASVVPPTPSAPTPTPLPSAPFQGQGHSLVAAPAGAGAATTNSGTNATSVPAAAGASSEDARRAARLAAVERRLAATAKATN